MDKATDIEFLKLISPYLPRFHRTGNDVYNFRCPFCGDSAKSKTKSRAYAYPKGNKMAFHCHNCGEPANMHKLISKVDPNLANQYALKSFFAKGKSSNNTNSFTYTPNNKMLLDESTSEIPLPAIAELPDAHPAKIHLLETRKIPEYRISDLYYTNDFARFIKTIDPDNEKELMDNDARIIIPLRNKLGQLIGVQGNSFINHEMRYITIQLVEEHLFWNRDNVDETKPVLVFEGSYDAMFFENSVATLSSSSMEKVDIENKILVFDNEPFNKQTVRFMETAMNNGQTVCVWNEPFAAWKDVNDMIVKGGFSASQVYDFIMKNSYNNLRLRMEILEWKKRK